MGVGFITSLDGWIMRLHYRQVLSGDALSLCDKRSGTKLFLRCRLKTQVPAFVNGPLKRIPQSFRRRRLFPPSLTGNEVLNSVEKT